MSVHPSVRPSIRDNSALTGQTVMKFGIFVFFKVVTEFQVSLKTDKNNGHFTLGITYVYDNISLISS
jgi:hypothetical protein